MGRRTRLGTGLVTLVLTLGLFAGACGGESEEPASNGGPALTATPPAVVPLYVAGPSPTAESGDTIVVTYGPPSIDPTSAEDGRCWTSSVSAGGRAGAYRCMTENLIYDPCFEDAGQQGYVLCPGDPSVTDDDVALRADFSELEPEDGGSGRAWFFVTIDGLPCTALTGTVPLDADGRPLPFGCRTSPSGFFDDFFCAVPEEGDQWMTECFDETLEVMSTHVIETIWY